MTTDETRVKKRLRELSQQSLRGGFFVFTDFLSPLEASFVYELGLREKEFSLWGGLDSAERVIARFGDAEEFGYEQPFPIRILRVGPLDGRFAEKLGHRDFLGALVHLGIDRVVLGDIFVEENGAAYVFAHERMAEFIREQLVRVRHTSVTCEVVDALPEGVGPKREARSLVVASSRIDGVIAKVFGLSRNDAKAVFAKNEVFKNARLCVNPASSLDENDVVSVRHKGKFIYRGNARATKKGNERIEVEVYV